MEGPDMTNIDRPSNAIGMMQSFPDYAPATADDSIKA
ncbi:hypothetical protein AVEN_250131-1, partial [Araneus ventricosus]